MANARNVLAAPAADFVETNPWLSDGEERVETDTRKSKIGPGYWNDLDYGAGQTGGSGASGVSVVDLGTVSWAAALANPVTLYTPTGPTYFKLIIDPDGFVDTDVTSHAVPAVRCGLNAVTDNLFYNGVLPSSTHANALQAAFPRQAAGAGATSEGLDAVGRILSTPVVAGLVVAGNTTTIPLVTTAWQANHAYGFLDYVTESGRLWLMGGSEGNSGGSKPDFAGNLDGSVSDGAISWDDSGVLPTVGAMHFYALVGTPT